jgi:hypothetical protein
MSKTRNLANSAPQFNSLIVPTGNTAQRPANTAGQIRYNTDLGTLESANGVYWANVGSGAASSSGSGGVSWQTVQNTSFIAVAGNGYGVNTATGNVIVTLPSSPTFGQQIQLTDYGNLFTSNNLIIYPNGNKIQGNTSNVVLQNSGASLSLVYFDNNKGWVAYSGLSSAIIGTYAVDVLLVAGGGSGGGSTGGGGGAGGLIYQSNILTNSGSQYPITVGAGGGPPANQATGSNGSNTTGFTYTAIGGGKGALTYSGGSPAPGYQATSGGSGGGGASYNGYSPTNGGSGTSGQGSAGGSSSNGDGGGGGGAAANGTNGNGSGQAGPGGAGLPYFGNYYAGGGGGGSGTNAGSGGSGGGGAGSNSATAGVSGTTNTGGGGGGGWNYSGGGGGGGGSGVVIVRYPGNMQKAVGGTVTITGGYVYHTFNSSGTFIA